MVPPSAVPSIYMLTSDDDNFGAKQPISLKGLHQQVMNKEDYSSSDDSAMYAVYPLAQHPPRSGLHGSAYVPQR